MILSGAVGIAFWYFLFSFAKSGWLTLLFFAAVIVIVHLLHKKRHFKTAELNLFFLYAISLLFWLKGYPHILIDELTYILGTAGILFSLIDLFQKGSFFKNFIKWSAWIFVGVAIALIMNVRFNSWPLSVVIGAIVIPIALRDKEHSEKVEDRS